MVKRRLSLLALVALVVSTCALPAAAYIPEPDWSPRSIAPVAPVAEGVAFTAQWTEQVLIARATQRLEWSAPRWSESRVGDATFFFQGRELDTATGLYDFRNRWYSAELGRFLSRDPLGYPDGPNSYAAFGARPTNSRDPFGLYEADVHAGITYYLARAAGLTSQEARALAAANVGVDTRAETNPQRNAQKGNWDAVLREHFAIDPGDTTVKPANKTSVARVTSARSLLGLGIGLHTLQDSFSHANAYRGNITAEADTPLEKRTLLAAKLSRKVRSAEQGITHEMIIEPEGDSMGDVVEAIKAADKTWRRPELALEMEQVTYEAILNYMVRTGRIDEATAQTRRGYFKSNVDSQGRVKHKGLVEHLEDFNRAATKQDKKHWLSTHAEGADGLVDWNDVDLPGK